MTTASPFSPPHSAEAEQAVLGSILASPELLGDLTGVLATEDFYVPAHQEIFDALIRLADLNGPTDETSVMVELDRQGLLEKLPDGPAYIATLADRGAPAHAHYYAGIVREERLKRDLAKFHMQGLQQIREGGNDANTLVGQAQSGLDEVTDQRSSSDMIKVVDSLMLTMDRMEELGKQDGGITGVPTGFSELDERTSGLHPGQMIVIAARPGVGKSTLGLDWARSAALAHNQTTAIFSLEMSHEEITMRLLSAEGRIPLSHVRTGKLSEDEWGRISRKYAEIADAPLYIDDTPNITMSEIKAKCRRLKQRHDLKLVVIDYLQLMDGDGRANSRQEEVSAISRGCKLLAKELGVAVVVMSQLNRSSEQRADRKPAVSDLRESGAIEQDADMIILLYREDLVDPDSARVGEADIIIGKQRNGPLATIAVAFQGHYSRFRDMGHN